MERKAEDTQSEQDRLRAKLGDGALAMRLREIITDIGLALHSSHGVTATDILKIEPLCEKANIFWETDHSEELCELDQLVDLLVPLVRRQSAVEHLVPEETKTKIEDLECRIGSLESEVFMPDECPRSYKLKKEYSYEDPLPLMINGRIEGRVTDIDISVDPKEVCVYKMTIECLLYEINETMPHFRGTRSDFINRFLSVNVALRK